VLYGMGYPTDLVPVRHRYAETAEARARFARLARLADEALVTLLPHRELIERIRRHGLQTI
jgi:tryptophan halogenase